MRRAELVIESRLNATEERFGQCYLPRIIRLCRKFKFSKNEARIAIYCLICQFRKKPKKISIIHSHIENRSQPKISNSVKICQFLDIPILELLRFLRKERQHMKQELFSMFREADINLSFNILYDHQYCKILVGSKVTAKEFAKLEQNFLAELVAEEPGNEHLK